MLLGVLPVELVLLWNRILRRESALALLVARVAVADDHDAAVTANHLAVLADGLDAGLDLHVVSF
ncbi:hypothetical protein GCM10025867_13420 [Frondihabitans sucicola]|uniref:Secreted protein n=1 Tax=Frondihabitans sucicola TaxID=1268041 RepID=A0ABM8GL36_9MICO|nr:hypothetical protein GCM10025867_13420 [Frondihabitans sucicola]